MQSKTGSGNQADCYPGHRYRTGLHDNSPAAMNLFERLKSWLASAAVRRDPVVAVDEAGVNCEQSDGSFESVQWKDLQEVIVITTEEGPFVEDVFFLLRGTQGGCLVPQGNSAANALCERLFQLPGFDSEAFSSAMGSTSNAEFLCWRRPADATQ